MFERFHTCNPDGGDDKCFITSKYILITFWKSFLTEKDNLLLDLIFALLVVSPNIIDFFTCVLIFWVPEQQLLDQAWSSSCLVTYWLHVSDSTRLSKGNFPVREERLVKLWLMSAEHPKQLSHSICERTREEEARGQRCLNGRASGGGRRLPNGHALSFVPRPKKNWGMLLRCLKITQ